MSEPTSATQTPDADPRARFEAARAAAATAAKGAAARASRLGLVRLVAFFGLIALIILVAAEASVYLAIPVVALGLVLFNWLVDRQQALDREAEVLQRVTDLNAAELAALDYDFAHADGGGEFRDAAHPYTGDLDVFGANSVFRQHNFTASLVGRHALASYMREPLRDTGAIERRQVAVAELAADFDWRQRFLAAGSPEPVAVASLDKLRAWAVRPRVLTQAWWPAAIYGLGVFNVLWFYSLFYLPFYVALLAYVPTFLLLRSAKPAVDEVHASVEEVLGVLGQFESMIAAVEARGGSWASPLLRELAGVFATQKGTPASRALRELSAAARQLGIRVNPFVIVLNVFSFWEVRYARALEAWKSEHLAGAPAAEPEALRWTLPTAAGAAEAPPQTASRLEAWLLGLGSLDALTSFAGVRYRYPAWTFPRFSEATHIEGHRLHHPLLPPDRSVSNDFDSPARAHIKLLTGSNMAGKSTFLRTVGLHIAMAHWGGAVPAASLRLPLLRVYTSMRTQDDLHEGASAFYAELKRLRVVVQATERGENVFFLLDEILKGTNSQDRHAGGRALLEQLIRQGGAGIVATHDLELGNMAAESDAVDNIRLEVEISDAAELYFDYTVKPGLAQSRNASVLMESMGLGGAPEAR